MDFKLNYNKIHVYLLFILLSGFDSNRNRTYKRSVSLGL